MMPKSLRSERSQVISEVADVIAGYSALADEQDTTECYFVFQELGLSPKKYAVSYGGTMSHWTTSLVKITETMKNYIVSL